MLSLSASLVQASLRWCKRAIRLFEKDCMSARVASTGYLSALSKGDYTHFGGVSLPAAQKTSSFLWEKIVENAKDRIG
ncbi:hypothetical protein Y032_0019g3958 [Ancylostoma ceylanicum]|uniref:Uncharacterized protein n=1 Tax=Ancylostoma ceylanicum TaxID=53326 RepID=A0A016V2K6_9BILA|nr:hypothetical protein Y032_0019g3958 [Ancylostoma ceylanicum]